MFYVTTDRGGGVKGVFTPKNLDFQEKIMKNTLGQNGVVNNSDDICRSNMSYLQWIVQFSAVDCGKILLVHELRFMLKLATRILTRKQ